MRENRSAHFRDSPEVVAPENAIFRISPQGVHISDGKDVCKVQSASVARSQVLTHAQANAEGKADIVPVATKFPAEQVKLWAAYTRAPRVFAAHAYLLDCLAVIEVADMLEDATSLERLCRIFVDDYIAPLTPPSSEPATDSNHGALKTLPAAQQHACRAQEGRKRSRAARLRAACSHPPPPQRLCRAFLWGAGGAYGSGSGRRRRGTLQDMLRGVGPARPHSRHHTAQAKATSEQAHSQPPAPPDDTVDVGRFAAAARRDAVWKSLEALPEHLLLRVLRVWAAPLATQLATLPRRMHPAAVAAAQPSVDASRSVSLEPQTEAPLRCALRAVAALAAMCRIDSVTLHPPLLAEHDKACVTKYAIRDANLKARTLHYVAARLRGASAVTSLHLAGTWIASDDTHGLACMDAVSHMPHLRAIGLEELRPGRLPVVLPSLSRMRQLQELSLALHYVHPMRDGGWGGAAVVERLAVLTALQAVRLEITHKALDTYQDRDRAYVHNFAAQLHGLEGRRAEYASVPGMFTIEGRRPPADVLRTLCAAAPQLDLARCTVEDRYSIMIVRTDGAEYMHEALWDVLMDGPDDRGTEVEACVTAAVGHQGMRFNAEDASMEVPPEVLCGVPGLKFLRLGGGDLLLTGRDAAALGRGLPALTRLTHLTISDMNLAPGAARQLLPQLRVLRTLRTLDLSWLCLRGDGGAALAAGLPALGELTALRLAQNCLGEEGASAVMAALPPTAAAGLVQLDLGWNKIGLVGAAAVALRLPEMSSLQELDLGANMLYGSEGVDALLRGNSARGVRLAVLTHLNLARNFLECAGATALARVLAQLPALEELLLRSNAIGHRGMRALARRTVSMPRLTHVMLDFNCVGDAGAQALARTLRRSSARPWPPPAPRCVYSLGQNGIGDAGALALAAAVLGPTRVPQHSTERSTRRVAVCLYSNLVSAVVWNAIAFREARAAVHVRRTGLQAVERNTVCATPHSAAGQPVVGEELLWEMDA